MFDFKPDYEAVRSRYLAWWDGAVVDRPLVSIYLAKPPDEQVPVPRKQLGSLRDRWLDATYQAERAYAETANTIYYADALPVRFPNLGPDIFAAFYGCDLQFGEATSWSVPFLQDWKPATVDGLRLDTNGFWFRKLEEMTSALLEVAQGKFIVGYTDLHPGADALAAFRDPQGLCMDILTDADAVRAACGRITDDFLRLYDLLHARLTESGMPSTSWLPAICAGKFHIPSCDFSCMISDETFEDVFLPGLERECAHMDRCIYHLDGPQALRFLDRILYIPNLHAMQWVPGAGREDWREWVSVYRRIQARGKSFTVGLPAEDVETFMAVLRPEGAWLTITGVTGVEHADAILKTVSRWGVTGG